MTDIVLENVRAIVLAIIVIFLWNSGQNRFEQSRTDWNLIVLGFGLLLFGSILDITDNFEGLNPYIVIGDTQTEAFLEKVVGFLGGFIFISIGLFNWIPTVQGLSDLVDTRTRDLQEINNSLVTEVDSRKRAEETLRLSEERYRNLVETSHDLIWSVDREGKFTFVNRNAAMHILGYEPGEMIGRSLAYFKTPEQAEKDLKTFSRIKETGGASHYETSYRKKDGSFVDMSFNAVVVKDSERNLMGTMGTAQDISQRKRSDEQLQQSQKMQAVGQLTGGIAHEFNNILTVVISNLDILDKGDLNENDASTLMQHSTDAAYRGAKLTKQLLAFSRREMLRPEILQTNDLILDEVDFLRPTLGDEITIEAYRAEDLELIEVDRQLLGNAILNLALNARTAMPEGGTLTIETASFDLEEELFDEDGGLPSGRYVMLTVIDTGYGMSPDVLEHAFEPFFTTKGLAEGSGLGLSMVYGFVKQSGGHVTIESEEGKGTTVRLFFPVVRGVAEEKKTDAKDKGRRPIGKKTVLVVENDEAIRNMLVIVLNSLGLETHEAEDGLEALEALDRVSHIDLLFTDVVLSDGMSGTELAHEARDRDRDIKVLLTSGYSEQALAREGKLDEEFDLFPKPYSITELVERLRTVLEG
jgi:PAS domain S-box-containing protein